MRDDLPICRTCGVQYGAVRGDCPICEDERQYVGWDGQEWVTLGELCLAGHHGRIEEEGPGIVGIGTDPPTAIGQRALLVRAPSGNVLWDMITFIDDDLVERVEQLGGVSAIAISHPHFYGSMIEWAHAFDAPVYIHAADRQWVARPDDSVVFWKGDTNEIGDGLTLINAGVHFAGGQVLHWRDGEGGSGGRQKGALLSGDIFTVVQDRGYVSFMYSYPNHIPERPRVIRRALELIEPFGFERVYGAWWRRVVYADAVAAVRRSADRYLEYALDDGA
ncbi:MAG: MBL fold metallo-hydrolase [Actinomycetota bacterium]|nr:MBL fold metallo-hydrolase [Actinomycetota bacterium]